MDQTPMDLGNSLDSNVRNTLIAKHIRLSEKQDLHTVQQGLSTTGKQDLYALHSHSSIPGI